ncbi:MAG: hypothetical protein AAF733_07735, partial [Verrucomicrobiota bacterium]
GSSMVELAKIPLEQEGPGWYTSTFRPAEPGVYLVRARAGSQIVSAGHVHNPSTEVATGQVDEETLKSACEISGGSFLESPEESLELTGSNESRQEELWPWILKLFVAVFLLDLFVRRWENVLGVVEQAGRLFKKPRSVSSRP